LLTHHRIKRVPIVREGKLVGIVTRDDLVRVIVRMPEGFSANAGAA
jgi:CBS domain-containing protein